MADSEYVTIRHPQTLEEREVNKRAVRFFVNQGYEVLNSRGRVSGSATAAATSKEN